MHEDNYKDLHSRIVAKSCAFEKAILQGFADCKHAQKHLLAEREAINCQSQSNCEQCNSLLNTLRSKSRFSLQQTITAGPLPHNKELQVQVGGLIGLQQIMNNADPTEITALISNEQRFENDNRPIKDIYLLLTQALKKYRTIDSFPFTKLVRTISRSHLRNRRRQPKT